MILPVVWFLTDPRNLGEKLKSYFKLKSILFFLAELTVVGAALISNQYFSLPKMLPDGLSIISGLILFFLGMFIAIWAKMVMKSSWGLPAEHDFKRQNKIIKKGPFAYSRNPIYIGIVLVLLGYTLALQSLAIFLVPFIIWYFYKAALKEEKNLSKYFGKEYLDYKSKTPRFI